MTRQPLTDIDVWAWMEAGCNAAEIAAYAGWSRLVVITRMNCAARLLLGVR